MADFNFVPYAEMLGSQDESLYQGNFTADSSQTFHKWYLGASDAVSLNNDIATQLGYTVYQSNGTPRMSRILPTYDPLHPFCYLDSYVLKGVGTSSRAGGLPALPNPEANLGDLFAPNYALWDQYVALQSYMGKEFLVISDESIPILPVSYFDVHGNARFSNFALESARFTIPQYIPVDDWLTQTRGNAFFSSTDGFNNTPTQQQPRMLLPNFVLKILWLGVPWRYMLSQFSLLTQMRGYINQNAVTFIPGVLFPAGSVLYLGANMVRTYTPPALQIINVQGDASWNKLMDVEVNFLITFRKGTALPSAVSIPNPNFIVGGHNLLPCFDKLYRYTISNEGSKTPSFLSAPLETLFSDPDSILISWP